MYRRTYLALSTGAIAGLAGCSGILGGSDGSGEPSGPVAVARAFFEATIDGDVEAANGYQHPESPDPPIGQSNVESFQSANARVESASEASEDDAVIVHVVVSAEDDSGERGTVTYPLEMRQDGDEWHVYEDLRATDTRPRPPVVQWEPSERTDADGSATALEFTHTAGDAIDSGTLSVRVKDETVSSPSGTNVIAGTTIVVPLEGRGDSLPASTEVTLLWSSSDDGTSQPVASHVLSSPTVGTLGESIRIVG